ncbi:hypothetical protein KRR38_30485 [Novosphingobium sp. G106]|uniref:hypothetical protein n=1 Tax=Novosphingobium sp. G106 TaxID=2849500 RepID=UPI001C2CD03D|nr:hypothetical protein [Novosphingobium sp. G106]MBV1691877.1 hypothetical protein [Novosphingobium sp. G106]
MTDLAHPDPPPQPTVIGEGQMSRDDSAAAVALVREVAGLLDHPLDDVWWSLCNCPAWMSGLLDSPEGWGALANYMSSDLG